MPNTAPSRTCPVMCSAAIPPSPAHYPHIHFLPSPTMSLILGPAGQIDSNGTHLKQHISFQPFCFYKCHIFCVADLFPFWSFCGAWHGGKWGPRYGGVLCGGSAMTRAVPMQHSRRFVLLTAGWDCESAWQSSAREWHSQRPREMGTFRLFSIPHTVRRSA